MSSDYSIFSLLHESPVACGLCRRQFISGDGDGEGDVSLEAVCGDCKFLLLEDQFSLSQRTLRRRSSSSINTWADDTPGPSSPLNSDPALSESGSLRWNITFSDTDIDILSNSGTRTPPSVRSNYYDPLHILSSDIDFDTDSDIDPMHAYSRQDSESEEDDRRAVGPVHTSWTIEGPWGPGSCLRRVVVGERQEGGGGGGVECVICREGFREGGDGDRLPCSHLYHPDCISEWLRTSNSCPICRYELPLVGGGEADDGISGGERSGRWRVRLAAAAAPILSISAVGIVIGLSLKRWRKAGGWLYVGKKRG